MTFSQFLSRNKRAILVGIFGSFWSLAVVFYSCSDKKNNPNTPEIASIGHSNDKLTDADYVGSESCKSCHETEYQDWEGSHHDKAMMVADENSVLADFNTTFTSQGVSSKFYQKDGKFFVNTEGKDGIYNDFEILYTFGIEPLQQYIVEFPRGKFQCLRTA